MWLMISMVLSTALSILIPYYLHKLDDKERAARRGVARRHMAKVALKDFIYMLNNKRYTRQIRYNKPRMK